MILQLFALLLSLFAMPCINRYLGSPNQKAGLAEIAAWLGTRVTGYALYAMVVLFLAASCGISPVHGIALSLLLTAAFAFFRQRSPRGAFFAITGRPALGRINAVSAWLVEAIHGMDVSIIITGTREQLIRYGRLYGFWHGLWGLLVGSIPVALLHFSYAPVAALAGGLMGLCYYLAGPYGRIFDSEERAHERAEYATGLFVILPFTLLVVLGSAYCQGGIMVW